MQESHLLHPESVTDEQISAILKKHFHKSDTKLLVQQVLTGNFPRISYPFIITGEAALPLRWLHQLPLCGLAARNYLHGKLLLSDKFSEIRLYFFHRLLYNKTSDKLGFDREVFVNGKRY